MNPNPNISNKIKVAVVQASPVILDKAATISKLRDICKESGCHGKGAQLILFPEAFISYYPRENTFGNLVGAERNVEGREQFRKYWESSVNIPGPEVLTLSQIAQENKLHLVVGVIEREDNFSGTLYCTILFFDDEGKYLGKHRKLMPTAGERLAWGQGGQGGGNSGNTTVPVFQTKLGRIGGAICWENYMPLLRMSLYGKGVQIYLAPNADPTDSWHNTVRHIATEGRCYVLSCCQFVKKGDYKSKGIAGIGKEFKTEDPNYVVSRGGSCIINPYGDVLAGPNFEGETVLHAELDLDEVIRAKMDFDPVGHYSRPDIFSLVVNDGHSPTVTYVSSKNEEDEREKVNEELRKLNIDSS